jgi:hypothetical protein
MVKSKTKIPLSESHPDLAKEWEHEKNHPLTPDDVTAGSGKKCWWVCEKGYDYFAVIHS